MDRTLATLAERIAARRKELGLRQEDLADAAGVSKAAVSQWERGETKNLKLEHLFKIADALKLHARWLALGQGPRYVVVAIAATLLTLPPRIADAAVTYAGCVLCQMRSVFRDAMSRLSAFSLSQHSVTAT